MIKFSIVTPSFNQGEFIGDTIKSVLGQDYPHFDYIVIDGGSTDGTLDILRLYEDKITWISEPDGGQSNAINKGFRMANGNVFGWLNSDDTYLPGALRSVADFLQEHPSAGLVYGDIIHVGADGQFLKQKLAPEFVPHKLLRRCFIPQPATFFRSDVWDAVDGLDEKLHYAMDWDLWLRMAQRCGVRKLSTPLANFRWHRQSKTFAIGYRFAYEEIYVVRRRYTTANPIIDTRDFVIGTCLSAIRSLLYLAKGKL